MKSLFYGPDKNWGWNEDADAFDKEIQVALAPIIKKWLDMGYSPRELEHIFHSSASLMMLWMVIPRIEGK